jgi:hypothetical protein
MYEQLLILMEHRIDEIAGKLSREMQDREEVRHYRKFTGRSREERIGNVIRDMCERLGCWLNKEAPSSSLSGHYSRLGAQRSREGIPLDEVVLVFLLIKRRIWDELKHKLVVDNSFTLGHLRDLENNYHLFFDRMIQSVITGYLGELKKGPGDGAARKKESAGRKKACAGAGKGKPAAGTTAEEGKR